MRFFVMTTLLTTLVACGSAAGGGANAAAGTGTESSTGTGTDPAAASSPSYHSMLVEDADSLPPCTPEAEGWLVYVKADEVFQACSAEAWTEIEIKGKPGDPGEPGEAGSPGERGEQGEPGTGLGLSAQYVCDGSNDLVADADKLVRGLNANIVRFSNGDYFVSCIDQRVLFSSLDSDTSSYSVFFHAESAGVSSGVISCVGFYATGFFDVADESILWETNDETSSERVSCDKVGGS